MTEADLHQRSVNTIRFLSADAVQQAKSGHPGLPMGAAAMAYSLWTRHLRFNPSDPTWSDRDRFVLSAGHGSMLLYSLLHLTGYDLPLDEIKNFRQWGSMTPGHPESTHAPGVEVTTGPLGQGFVNGVGMAVAERFLSERFNDGDDVIVNHYTYAIVSDGDLEEGITSEAASYAGTQRLGKLIYLYDDNNISIEGDTDVTFREDVGARFRAYGWQVLGPLDGNDIDAVSEAIEQGKADAEHPTLIICQTVIGYGSPNKAGTGEVHGEPLGDDELALAKENLGWPTEPRFLIPDDVRAHFREAKERGSEWQSAWQEKFAAYQTKYPEKAAEFLRMMSGELPAGWEEALPTFAPEDGPVATRSSSGKVLNAIFSRVPDLVGGSADLAPSTKTWLNGSGKFGWDKGGHNLQFGIREHAMGAMALGMAHHGGVIPFTATFLVFSDYMRPPIRLASLSKQRVVFVFTHDSIGLGEDGPTHQPVEHLAALRAVPGLRVIRPADANETAQAWRAALLHANGPTVLVFTRQNLPVLDQEKVESASNLSKGAYVLTDEDDPSIILVASGSEVSLILAAADVLSADGIKTRVVSMPCWELFDEQPASYREAVLSSGVPKLAVEAGVPMGWHRYVGTDGDVIGLDRFGASAPGSVVMDKLGFNVDHVVTRAKALLK